MQNATIYNSSLTVQVQLSTVPVKLAVLPFQVQLEKEICGLLAKFLEKNVQFLGDSRDS